VAQVRDGKFAPLRIKLLWTSLFFVCFMIGRHIPINLLHGKVEGSSNATANINAANIMTGGNFFSPSLFSLGLGPWMGAAILWRFLFIGKLARDRKIPEETVKRARNVLIVALAVLQAISLMSRYEVGSVRWGPFSDRHNAQIVIVVLLAAGAILVAWLANKNEDLGLGGVTMFILYQLLITAKANRGVLSVATHDARDRQVLWLVVVACLCVLILGVFAGNAELRLHVNKVSIDSGFTGMSYLPIKLNPAGASPIMYGLALVALPQYVARALGTVAPATSAGVGHFLTAWTLTNPVGFIAYLVVLFCLSIFFGLITVDPKDVAKRMQKAGEYFDHIPPGRATRRFVRRRVVLLSAISGVLLVVLTGLPMHFIGSHPSLQYLLTAPGTLVVLLGLLWMLHEEIADTLLGTKYVFSFKPRTKPRSSKAPSSRATA